MSKENKDPFIGLFLFFLMGVSFSPSWHQTQEVAKDGLKLLILQPQPRSAGIICIMPSNFGHFYLFIYH